MNSLVELLIFVVVGKIFIYLWMLFPLPKFLNDRKIVEKLHTCGLCSGVWIYSILFILFTIDIFPLLGIHSSPIIGNILSGGVISFIVHIFSLGWSAQFETIILE